MKGKGVFLVSEKIRSINMHFYPQDNNERLDESPLLLWGGVKKLVIH